MATGDRPLPLIYIAGPFAAPTIWELQHNINDAEDLGLRVAQCGAMPVIPHTMNRNFYGQLNEEFWLRAVMQLLARCDGLVLTHTWERSKGARVEHDWAKQHNMPLYVDTDPKQAFIMGREWPLRQFVEDVRATMRALAGNVGAESC